MATPIYTDLLITDNDLTLNGGGEPLLVHDRACIAQDMKHLIRETGLLFRMVGERSPIAIEQLTQQLVLEIETDTRLIPGTVAISRVDVDTFFITADTVDFGPIEFNQPIA